MPLINVGFSVFCARRNFFSPRDPKTEAARAAISSRRAWGSMAVAAAGVFVGDDCVEGSGSPVICEGVGVYVGRGDSRRIS